MSGAFAFALAPHNLYLLHRLSTALVNASSSRDQSRPIQGSIKAYSPSANLQARYRLTSPLHSMTMSATLDQSTGHTALTGILIVAAFSYIIYFASRTKTSVKIPTYKAKANSFVEIIMENSSKVGHNPPVLDD